jgi:4-amino-4-deoxy-L-arabinose transferase-like glycosyltransferase
MRLTPPGRHSRPSNFPQSLASLWRLGAQIGLVATAVFASGIRDPSFVDEYAYITQSYYSDLFFGGRLNDAAWLTYPAFDLPPLPKYCIGPGLRAIRVHMPGPRDAQRWYRNSHTQYGPPQALTVARLPFIATGVLGCVSVFLCGSLVGGRWVGAIGAVLLMFNPLYRLHAHRAMSDVPCEAFVIAALTLAMSGYGRVWSGRGFWSGFGGFAASGVCLGLALLCKLNGLLAPMIIAAWCGLGVVLSKLEPRNKRALSAGLIVAIVMGLALLLALNPALTARPGRPRTREEAALAAQGPWRRFREMIELRLESSRGQQKQYPHNALETLAERLPVFAVQGFGRFGPLGPKKSNSVVRYERRQDWGLVLWWPVVVIGAVETYRLGRQQLRDGLPPSAFGLLIWAAVAWVVVALYLPMAWDRYLLSIQAPNALLAAVGVHGLCGRWRGKAVNP